MTARLCALVKPHRDGRSRGPTVAGLVRYAGAELDADMATDPFATGGFRGPRAAFGASLVRARSGLAARLKLVRPRGFAKANANSGGATAD